MASGVSAGRDPYDEEAAARRPLEFNGRDAALSSDHRPGNVMPRYQVGSTKGDTSSRYAEGSRSLSTDDERKSKPGSRYYTAFGVDLSPDNMAVAIVYFVQGVLGLARLAVSFYLKDDLHLDPAELYLASHRCHGWSSPSMALSVFHSTLWISKKVIPFSVRATWSIFMEFDGHSSEQ